MPDLKKNIFENNYFGAYFQKIPFVRLKRLLDKNHIDLSKKSILVAGCGIGTDVYYLEKFYKFNTIFVSDINKESLDKTISAFPYSLGIIADHQKLSFKDNSIDFVMVGASLHHLKEPIRGLYELIRVAKYGLMVIEPNDTWLTRLFEKLGWAREYEVEHGNYVYRFRKRDIDKISKALFFKYDLTWFFAVHKVAKTRLEFIILKFLNSVANLFFPCFGNYIVFIIRKEKIIPKCLKDHK